MPSLRREKLGIISGRPQRLTLPVSAGRYRTCHDPTWKWETRQISGMMPIVVSPLVSTCSRAVGNRIKSAIVHTFLSVLNRVVLSLLYFTKSLRAKWAIQKRDLLRFATWTLYTVLCYDASGYARQEHV